jgi:hypothetical protein
MLRRTFLASLPVINILPNTLHAKNRPPPTRIKHKPADVVIDQSGVLGNGVFVVGALTSPDPNSIARAASLARVRTKYRTTLSHKSRDKWKVNYTNHLLNAWLSTAGTRIDVIVVNSAKNQVKESPADRLNRYVDLIGRLIDAPPRSSGHNRRLVTQQHNKKEQQDSFENALSLRSSRYVEVLRIRQHESDILQLVDLVVGSVQASQHDSITPVENQSKLLVIRQLTAKLGVNSLTKPVRNSNFSITYA